MDVYWIINFYIDVPSKYLNKTKGLCGNNNGDSIDDQIDENELKKWVVYNDMIASLEYLDVWK